MLCEDQRAISEYYARPERTMKTPKPRLERGLIGLARDAGAAWSLAYLECRLHSAQDAGDHTIFIAEVEDVVVRDGDPLLFFRGNTEEWGE